jgi:hypothetical protein
MMVTASDLVNNFHRMVQAVTLVYVDGTTVGWKSVNRK